MQLTTTQVIKTLPFDESFRQELLEKLPQLPENIKYDVVELLWDLYYGLYEMKFQENTDRAFERASINEEQLDGSFYKRIADQTLQDMQEDVVKVSTQVDLSDTRQKLQEIMNQTSDSSETTN